MIYFFNNKFNKSLYTYYNKNEKKFLDRIFNGITTIKFIFSNLRKNY